MSEPLPDLPQYRSHKIVRAAPINWIYKKPAVRVEIDGQLHVIDVPQNFYARSVPGPGDYLVVYSDGYMSWSPKAVFEAGYTKLDGEPSA
ncbi:MAG: hypothetical protein ACJ8FU_08475 [Xanthobacteraceae bacterium]